MRPLGFLLWPAVALCAQVSTPVDTASAAPQKPKVRLEGRVLNATTGEPLRKANLHLRMMQSLGMGPAPSPMPTLGVATDAEGKFTFEDLDAGRYTLDAERNGFVRQIYGARGAGSGGTNLTLDSGQELKDIVFKLVPQGTISGRVLDEDGDPVENSGVVVYRYSYVRGHREMQQYGGANVQADGTFLIAHLSAGRYYLSAEDRRNVNGAQWGERYGGKGAEEGNADTFFPSAADPASAAPVDVTAGGDVRGIEIRLRKSKLYSARGKVAGAGSQNITLYLSEKVEGRTMWPGMRYASVNRDGSFQFNRLTPGTYIMESPPDRRPGAPPSLMAYSMVTVSDHNVDGLVIAMSPGPEVSGTIKVEGWESLQPPQGQQASASTVTAGPQIQVSLNPTSGETRFGWPFANAEDDGTFVIRGVMPDKYRVQANNLPEGTYIKSIHLGGEDVKKMGLDLTSGSGGALEILLSPNAADISGVVHKEGGDAATGVRVTLWSPDDPDSLKIANTDQNGAFKLRNVAPGDYRIVAWEDVEPGLLQDPDFRARFENRAATLKIEENAHETPEVKLLSKDEVDAEAEKVK
jgi:hypothetical protein